MPTVQGPQLALFYESSLPLNWQWRNLRGRGQGGLPQYSDPVQCFTTNDLGWVYYELTIFIVMQTS